MDYKHFKAHLQYDGTRYSGWQVQPNHITIQETVEQAIHRLTGQTIRIIGAGRTDTGVHAIDQAFHFKLATRLDATAFYKGLNGVLPDDIIITDVSECDPHFHARFDSLGKHYMYILRQSALPALWSRHFMLHVRHSIDINLLRANARHFIGTHHYRAFSAQSGRKDEQYERTVTDVRIDHFAPFIAINVLGRGFLYKMVRMMVGTLLRINAKKESEHYIKKVFEDPQRYHAGPAAPAHGLTLFKTYYSEPFRLPSEQDIRNFFSQNDVFI